MESKPNNNKIILYFLILPLGFLMSCQKEILPDVNPSSNFSEIFDTFWNKMNTNYVYWDIDTTNWDNMYNKYKPIFEKLDLNINSDVIKSVQYFSDMTHGLIDGHFYISFSNPIILNSSVYPSLIRKEHISGFHYPYPYFNIDLNYLDPNYNLGHDSNNIINGQALTTLCGIIENRILFFSCTRFSLLKSYKSITSNGVKTTLQYFFEKLENLPENIEGIIIDVRGNPGGDLCDLNFFVGHLIDTPLHFGYTQTKSGNGRLDFTPWIGAYVNPDPDGKVIDTPIVVLADLNSASLSEAVVMAIKLLPNSTFVGETTWGATGPLTDEMIYNAGQFQIKNILSVKTSSCRFKYLDGRIYEGTGFPPDIYIPFNLTELINGNDAQLEKAISLIRLK